MAKQIGAGTNFLCGSGAAPTTLVDKSSFLKNIDLQDTVDTVDVTDLTADADGYTKKFILALASATFSGAGDEDVVAANSAFLFFDTIRLGTTHTAGRGKVDFKIQWGGAVVGNLQTTGTLLITQNNITLAHDGAIAGNRSFQVDGALTHSAQV